ncbi:MAG: ABC transporter ATP-binding protein [Planctomycetota bacterium]
MTDADAIWVRGLEKTYRTLLGWRRVRALRGLDLTVPQGAIYGLIGPNGHGKSTTIKCLLGFLRTGAGEARVLGEAPGHPRALARIGYLPEASPFPPVLTAESGLDFYGRLAGLDRRTRKARAAALIDRVGLGEARARRLSTYSKGMRRRFGLAQALLAEPALLILDEPQSGLDPLATRDLREILLAEQVRGATVLLSSHDLTELERVCSHVGVIHTHGTDAAGRHPRPGSAQRLRRRDGPPRRRLPARGRTERGATVIASRGALGSGVLAARRLAPTLCLLGAGLGLFAVLAPRWLAAEGADAITPSVRLGHLLLTARGFSLLAAAFAAAHWLSPRRVTGELATWAARPTPRWALLAGGYLGVVISVLVATCALTSAGVAGLWVTTPARGLQTLSPRARQAASEVLVAGTSGRE